MLSMLQLSSDNNQNYLHIDLKTTYCTTMQEVVLVGTQGVEHILLWKLCGVLYFYLTLLISFDVKEFKILNNIV